MAAHDLTILVIDDNRDNLLTLRAVLADQLPGARLLSAPDGPRGLDLARAEDPDVILLDIVMPSMDGYEVCRTLKKDECLRTIPVLFLTAIRTDRDSRIEALKAGADGFLAKPFDEIELTAQIRAMARIKEANLRQLREKEELATLVAERTRALERELAERKRAEQERLELIAQLEKRNAELEQFTYTISHDLKTPLVTIAGFTGQLRVDLEQGNHDCLGIDLDFIESAAIQMGTLMGNLLHLARSGRVIGEPHPVNLARTVREAVELARGVRDEGTIRIDVADDLPGVSGDADRLREVFQNLLENAAKFTAGIPEPWIEVGGKVEGDQVLCWVRDNGIGIPAEYQERIFRLFERIDPSVEGTGIGLAIVRRIIKEHGGRVWVESAGKGCGSTFFLTLPAVSPGNRQIPQSPPLSKGDFEAG